MMRVVGLVAIACLWCGVCVEGSVFGYVPPRAIHLAFTGNVTEMVVSWQTTVPTASSVVRVWEQGTVNEVTFTGKQRTYLASAGWFHDVKLSGLKSDTTFVYVCGSDAGWSPETTFRTAIDVQASNQTSPRSRFVMYGDMGIQNSHLTIRRVRERLASEPFDFIYHAGDYGYGDNRPAAYYDMSWDVFFDNLQEIMPSIPYMGAPGNHEAQCGESTCNVYAANFTVYNVRFNMPSEESGGAQNMWFSFDYQNIHFVTMSTETDYPGAPQTSIGNQFGDQIGWLQDDLEANAANPLTDWTIVVGHRPIYCTYNGGGTGEVNGVPIGNSRDLQKAFEDLFYKNGVDLVMTGHVHAYQRNYPIYQSKVCGENTFNEYRNPGCPSYVIAGAAGNLEGHYSGAWNPAPPAWYAFHTDEFYGYATVTVSGNRTLEWTWRRSVDDVMMDHFVIVKE